MNNTNINITSQNEAFKAIATKLEDMIKTDMSWDNIISLSGPAGTGKTYLTTKLVKQLSEHYHITITAPTHKALQVVRENLLLENVQGIDAKTLQSFLNISLVTDYNKGVQKFEPFKANKSKDTSKTDILIIDESSMVSSELYNFVITAIEAQRVKAVLFVGDEYQLLPIDNINSKILDVKTKFKLDKIVRQAKGSYIIAMATKARNIIKSKQYLSLSEFFQDDSFHQNIEFFSSEQAFHDDFCTPETWAKKDKVIASFTNNSVDHHNRIIRRRYWEAQNQNDIPALLAHDKIIFQEANLIDDKIVHQNSDIVELSSAKKYTIESLKCDYWDCRDLSNRPFKIIDPDSKERLKLVLDNIAKEAKYEKNYTQRTKKWKLFYSLKNTFVNVKYTYASTIHKLQGSTYESVYIDLRDIEKMDDKDMMFRLLYVAITRASNNVKILLNNHNDNALANFQEQTINSFDSMIMDLGMDL